MRLGVGIFDYVSKQIKDQYWSIRILLRNVVGGRNFKPPKIDLVNPLIAKL